MLRDCPERRGFEREQIRKEPLSYDWASSVFEEMYRHACAMGALPLRDPLGDLQKDIRLVKDVESLSRSASG
jgi:hypothetical protein